MYGNKDSAAANGRDSSVNVWEALVMHEQRIWKRNRGNEIATDINMCAMICRALKPHLNVFAHDASNCLFHWRMTVCYSCRHLYAPSVTSVVVVCHFPFTAWTVYRTSYELQTIPWYLILFIIVVVDCWLLLLKRESREWTWMDNIVYFVVAFRWTFKVFGIFELYVFVAGYCRCRHCYCRRCRRQQQFINTNTRNA